MQNLYVTALYVTALYVAFLRVAFFFVCVEWVGRWGWGCGGLCVAVVLVVVA